MHGDIGIVTKDDILLAISNSGETHELNALVGNIGDRGVPLIALTGNLESTLARRSDVVIDVGVAREACPFGLAPTSSTTAALAMGDALAVALVNKRQFGEKDFYRFHPGGSLGRRLMSRVKDVMVGGDQVPAVMPGTPAIAAVEEIDRKTSALCSSWTVREDCKGYLQTGTSGDVSKGEKILEIEPSTN